MPKNFFQDMVKIKRAEREQISTDMYTPKPTPKLTSTSTPTHPPSSIPIPIIIKKEEPPESIESNESVVDTKFASVYEVSDVGRGGHKSDGPRSKHTLWFVALASVISFIFAVSLVFSGAKVMVNPKIKDITLNENFSANKDSANGLPFELVAIPGEERKKIAGGEERDVAEAAEGSVLIYNAFSSTEQRLDVDTRLEGSNGKIYKTKAKIIVPGMKDSTPGSVEVEIYAVEAGEEYNSEPLDFKIFGFKGTPKYEKFYARSKGEITGGFTGKALLVSDADKVAAIDELRGELKTKLFKRALDQIPQGFVLFEDAFYLNITDEMMDTSGQDGVVPIVVKGTLHGLLFNEDKLTQEITKKAVPGDNLSKIYLLNIKSLAFFMVDKSVLATDIKNIDFNLSGSTQAVWKVEEDKLVSDLSGKKKKDFNQILSTYQNIESADLTVRPFWKMSFPEKANKISVIVNYPK